MATLKTTSATKARPAPANDGQASDLRTLTAARFGLIGDALDSIDDLAEMMRREAKQQASGRGQVYVERLDHISKLATTLMACTDRCNAEGDSELSSAIGWRDEAPAVDGGGGALTANPLAPAAYELVRNRARRMRLISEAVGSNLRELRGCEIDRDEMIETLDMLEEMATQVLESLHFLRPADDEAGH